MFKKFTRVDYLNSKGIVNAKNVAVNIKKGNRCTQGFEYLIPNAKNAFNHLRHMLTKASILQHFDSERHILVKTDTSGYGINGIWC